MKWILFCSVLVSTLVIGYSVEGKDRSEREVNKQIVVKFYQHALNEKDFDKASKYLGKRYIQHNPFAKEGRDGLKDYIAYLRSEYPKSHSTIKKVFVDGDHVILHVHSVRVPGDRGRAIVDIFRLENRKIVEHWDVIQDIPKQSANSNTMF